MSLTVSKRELNQQTSRVLATVQASGAVVVTERGVPLWRIEAVTGPATPLDRLLAAGRVIAAKSNPAPWNSTDQRGDPGEIDALLEELRADAEL